MRISKVSYPINSINTEKKSRIGKLQSNPLKTNTGFSTITFKSGNKEQVILFMAESEPYWKNGGVATVMTDMRGIKISANDVINPDTNSREYWAPKNKAMVDHIYNGMKVYDHTTGIEQGIKVEQFPVGLAADSPFKQFEGKYFLVKDETFQMYQDAADFLKHYETTLKGDTSEKKLQSVINKDLFILDDVTGSKRTIDFGGGTEDTEIKLFRVLRYDSKAKELYKTSDFKVFTDLTAGMKKPYQDGGYATSPGVLAQSWKGDSYAKSSKAFVELLERICEVMSEDGTKFDPATVLLNDSQASYAAEYMAEKAAKGGEFWQGKKPTMIVHNAGDGYIQKTNYQNMFVNLADKELRLAIEKDPQFIEALKGGNETIDRYFRSLLPKECFDEQGGVSPFRNTLYYADLGYVPQVSTVSDEYAKALCNNLDLAPGNQKLLKQLYEKGRFNGILNGFENESLNPYTVPGMEGYKEDLTILPDETIKGEKGLKLIGYKAYDPAKINDTVADLDHVKEIKRYNKISLLSRYDKDIIEALNKPEYKKEFNLTYAGLRNKTVKTIHGSIDSKYVDMLKQGEDVNLFVSWGRGDAQKALDTVMEAFLKYVKQTGDKNSVLIMGGEVPEKGDEADIIRSWAQKLEKDPATSGRFAFIEGFAPNKVLASAADFNVVASRFAPCELTDFEGVKVFSTPIVSNCQGLAQKNFDARVVAEAAKATGYKTVHEFYTSEEELGKILPAELKEQFKKDVEKFKNEIRAEKRLKCDKTMSEQEVMAAIRSNGELSHRYNFELLRPYRDAVMADELVDCFTRAVNDNANNESMLLKLKNQVKLGTEMGWEKNAALRANGISSAEEYRRTHFQADSAAIKEEDTLLYKLKQQCSEAIKRGQEHTKKAVEKTCSKVGMFIAIGAAVVAAAAALFMYHKNNNNVKND